METIERFERMDQKLKQARDEWTRRRTTRDLLIEDLKELQHKANEMQQQQELFDKVRLLFQKSGEYARKQAKAQLETLVTNALQYVFGSSFRFEIDLSPAEKNPTAEFYVVTEWNGEIIRTKPQDARGGGVVDIISLALRIAFLETVRPRLEGPILLDEPGKHVSEDYILPMTQFLQSVHETFERQILFVTHNAHLTESADQAFFVRLKDGKSEVHLSRRLDNGIS
ncbi:ATP-binding protein [Shimazuella alba]|uniref:ATP-binding protein n=1 Tax=Shimazuella alba TaxID=2690964 RepID=A0A6I4VPK9_9BACL|nr:ATP-binding protein [Shimazuella alba]MXQ52301.1 ATP-binding protein [Shimazuella alba]